MNTECNIFQLHILVGKLYFTVKFIESIELFLSSIRNWPTTSGFKISTLMSFPGWKQCMYKSSLHRAVVAVMSMKAQVSTNCY